ncbi:MAG: hypothetical protein ACI8W8_004710, partial [Rhodothermales bacterium]
PENHPERTSIYTPQACGLQDLKSIAKFAFAGAAESRHLQYCRGQRSLPPRACQNPHKKGPRA